MILVGNLGADPEVRTLGSGTKVARLRIATSEAYTNKEGERITNTEWHSVNVWRGLAEVAERYLKKGNQVYIEGKLRTRTYEDKEGNTRYVTEIEADNMTMLGGSGRGDSDSPAAKNEPNAPASDQLGPDGDDDETMDDLPF